MDLENNKSFDWSNIQFPIVKKVFGKLLSADLPSIYPMTIKEAAAGRKIKPYPAKYDSFTSSEDLKNYIENILHEDKNLKPEWLKIESSTMMPFNLRKDVYYTSYQIVSITCHRPQEHIMDDIIDGKTICELRPGDPLISEAHLIIEEFKKKL